jgi:hypothetical protein
MDEFLRGLGRVHFSMVGFALAAPGYTLRDVNDWFEGQGVSAERLVPQTRARSMPDCSPATSLFPSS